MIIILYFLLFIFVYNVPFTGVPLSGSKIAVLLFILIMFFESAKGNYIPIRRYIRDTLMLAILILTAAGFSIFINSSGDFSLVYSSVLLILNHILGAFLSVLILKYENKRYQKDFSLENVMKMLIILAVIQAIIIVMMMSSSVFYNFFSRLAELSTRDSIRARYAGARGYGLASSITYDLGVVQSFSLIFLAYFMQQKKNYWYVVAYLLILVSIFVTGRTALIGVILSIIYLILTDSKAKRKGLRTFVGVFLIAIILGIFLISGADENSILISLEKYVFEAFNNYKLTGRLTTVSGSNIVKMFESMNGYPIKTWLVGDGRYVGEGLYYYGNVDVGFLRHILYFGFLGCSCVGLFYIYVYKTGLYSIDKRSLKVIWVLLFAYLLIAHLKGDFLLGCGMGISYILILFVSILEERYDKQ